MIFFKKKTFIKNLDLEERLLNAIQEAENKVRLATDAKYQTIEAIKEHAKTLKKAVDDGQNGDWTAVNLALATSEKLAKKDIQEENSARKLLDNLRKVKKFFWLGRCIYIHNSLF